MDKTYLILDRAQRNVGRIHKDLHDSGPGSDPGNTYIFYII